MGNIFFTLLEAFSRRKPIERNETTRLNKCLGTLDLTALGIGSTLGVGVYVIIGTVAYKQAGPSVVLSFIIAAVCSIFAALCYAEFGALVPKAGSAYVYSYICVGELMAFIIGWNLILEYIIGAASVARSYSAYLDGLVGKSMQNFFEQYLKLPQSNLFSSYFDLFSFLLVMTLALILSFGVRESTKINTLFTVVNFFVILYCIIVGLFKVDMHNWKIDPKEIPQDVNGGLGGFFPFGLKGMVAGAATCFYSFVGFDAIATTGEEVLDPQRSLPLSIILSLAFVTFAYCSVAAVQTLMWPYWDQKNSAPLPYVFDKVGYHFAEKVIRIGALAGLSTSLVGSMFPMPRIIYAMAEDGLIFKFLSYVNPKFKTPITATLLSSFIAALMSAVFNVDQLAEMMSIGTLLAYTLVAISVLILRYKMEDSLDLTNPGHGQNVTQIETAVNSSVQEILLPNVSSKKSLVLIAITTILLVTLNVLLFIFEDDIYAIELSITKTLMVGFIFLLFLISIIYLSMQPSKCLSENSFKVPFVPFIPFLSIFANFYLMVHLSVLTWYRFSIWMLIGFIIYFSYGIVKSVGYLTRDEKNRLTIENENRDFSNSTSL